MSKYLINGFDVSGYILAGSTTNNIYKGFPLYSPTSANGTLTFQNLPFKINGTSIDACAIFNEYIGTINVNGPYSVANSNTPRWYTDFNYRNTPSMGAGTTTTYELRLKPNIKKIRCLIAGAGGGGGSGASNNTSPYGYKGGAGAFIEAIVDTSGINNIQIGVGNSGWCTYFHSRNDDYAIGLPGGFGGDSYVSFGDLSLKADGGSGGGGGLSEQLGSGGVGGNCSIAVPPNNKIIDIRTYAGYLDGNIFYKYFVRTGNTNFNNSYIGINNSNDNIYAGLKYKYADGGYEGPSSGPNHDAAPGYPGKPGYVRIYQLL